MKRQLLRCACPAPLHKNKWERKIPTVPTVKIRSWEDLYLSGLLAKPPPLPDFISKNTRHLQSR